jgi:hypothetical protein
MTIHNSCYVYVLVFIGALAAYIVLLINLIYDDFKRDGRS